MTDKMPSMPIEDMKQTLGEKIQEISKRGGMPLPGDFQPIKDCLDRPGGDVEDVVPVLIPGARYPGVLVRIPPKDLFESGKKQFLLDLAAGTYGFGEYFKQAAKRIIEVASSDVSGTHPARLTQQEVDRLEAYLETKPEFAPSEAIMKPEDLYDYLVGDYICRHCY